MVKQPQGLRTLLVLVGPGVLVAATGVGAGDLGGAAFAGSQIGLAVLWAVLVGAGVKFVLNEQLARWQLATGTTILEGACTRLGPVVWAVFGAYLLFWSPFVAVTLMKACMVTLSSMQPIEHAWLYGVGCSALGLVMVLLGGFALFQRVMATCIAVMFVVVVTSAIATRPDPLVVLAGFVPRPPADARALEWTIALVGGVGGTLTIICYAYWMRETGRRGPESLRLCRLDLLVGYGMTAIFGVAMVVLAAGVAGGDIDFGGSAVIPIIAAFIGGELGGAFRWAFLIGAFGAVFSSLLGVWQAVPYVFADWWGMRPGRTARGASTRSWAYRGYLLAIAVLPCGLLFVDYRAAQKWYGIVGAGFIPLLAIALVLLNNRTAWIGEALRNRLASNIALVIAIAISLTAAGWSIAGRL
ncbi:MAG: Nramp family divalent metal transporter [Planctomycetota bacterium]